MHHTGGMPPADVIVTLLAVGRATLRPPAAIASDS
jgi:hypothetical protein